MIPKQATIKVIDLSINMHHSFLYVHMKLLKHMFINFYWKTHIITIFGWAIQCDILFRTPHKVLSYIINYLHKPTTICIDKK
jgi:hypothetical protein